MALPDPADLTPPPANPAVVAPPTTPPPLPTEPGEPPTPTDPPQLPPATDPDTDPNAPQLADPKPAPAPPKAPAPAPADPKPAEPPPVVIPVSEQEGGSFRDNFLTLLAKKGSTLPKDWEVHHQYIEKLKDFWEKAGVKWEAADTGLGVSPSLNKEFNTLYNGWLKKYKIDDPAKLTADQLKNLTPEQIKDFKDKFEKFNAAIREAYKAYLILPRDTPDQVKAKYEAYQAATRPNFTVQAETD